MIVNEWASITFNLGISNTSYIDSVVSKSDKNPQQSRLKYYDILEEIVEIEYEFYIKVVLFKGYWYQKTIGEHNDVTQVEDECGFVKIKTTMKHNEEPWMSPKFIAHITQHGVGLWTLRTRGGA